MGLVRNQCDGCVQNLEERDGLHIAPGNQPVMCCTAYLYVDPQCNGCKHNWDNFPPDFVKEGYCSKRSHRVDACEHRTIGE